MSRKRSHLTRLVPVFGLLAVLAALAYRDFLQAQSIEQLKDRLSQSEKLIDKVAMPRFPGACVVVTMPDGRQGKKPLLKVLDGDLASHDRQVSNHWAGPDDWGDASSGGYFWRYIGSEEDRDVYEFVVVFGSRLPPKPDERTNSALVVYTSFRGAPVEVLSKHGMTISLVPGDS